MSQTNAKILEKSLDKYINDLHNQDECSGFIDGVKEALSQTKAVPLAFVKWYSGMEEEKILRALKKWQKENNIES